MIKRILHTYLARLLWNANGNWTYTLAVKQSPEAWTKFISHLEDNISGLEIKSLQQLRLFEKAWLEARKKNTLLKILRISIWISFLLGLFSIVVGLILLIEADLKQSNIVFAIIYMPMLVCISLMWWLASIFDNRSELTREQYIEGFPENERPTASRAIQVLDDVIAKHTFAYRDRAGKFKELPPEFIYAENVLLFLLGEEKHRSAIPFSGPFPKGPLYISKAKSTPHTRPKGEILEYLKDKARVQALYDFVMSFDGQEPTNPRRVLTIPRKRWMAAHKVLLDDFALWLRVEAKNATNKETQKFEKELSVALSGDLNAKNYKSYSDFIKGKNTDFRNWYVKLLKVMN